MLPSNRPPSEVAVDCQGSVAKLHSDRQEIRHRVGIKPIRPEKFANLVVTSKRW